MQVADNKCQVPIIYTKIYEEPEIFLKEIAKPSEDSIYTDKIRCHTFK